MGTPGLGRGSFAALAVEGGFPAGLHPTVEVIAGGGAAGARKVVFKLEGRC